MRFVKKFFLISLILTVALFLRTYKLQDTMQFIPDQGWFYLSARDMLLTGQIPLVGPPTSHPWIHHGPLWTYTLSILLWLFNYNPIAPAYFIALLGTITVGLYYFIVSKMYSRKIGLYASFLFATSPLIVMNSRIPYHTSPIPFFVILLFYLTFLWVKGRIWAFPFIAFLLGVLYNHEITTFVYFICIFIILFYGMLKRKKYVLNLINIKIIVSSILLFLIPMTPFILYDINHGYKQTIGFLIWVGYRIIKLPLSLIHPDYISSGSNPSTLPEFFLYYKDLLFVSNPYIAFILLFATFILGIYIVIQNIKLKRKKIKDFLKISYPSEIILPILFLTIGLTGLFIHRVPIEADTLLVAPFIILLTVLIWNKFFHKKLIFNVVVILVFASNVYFLISTSFFTQNTVSNRITYSTRIKAVEEILLITKNKEYSIIGKGELSNFPVFTMPYEYLLWWKGHAPTDSKKLKIVIWENKNQIIISKND